MVLRVGVPADGADRIFEKIDKRGAVLRNEAGARRPRRQLGDAESVLLREQRVRHRAQFRIERERRHGADEIGFAFGEHGAHGREGRLDDGVVLVGLQPVPVQHRPHRDVDRAAHGIGGEHLALEVGDGLHRAVIEHHEFVGAVARHAVLDLVADHAQVVHVRVLDGEAEGRKGQRPDVELAGRERRDDGRRAFEACGFGDIGLAEMLEDVLFLQHQRRGRGRHHDPADADFHRRGLRQGVPAASRERRPLTRRHRRRSLPN